MASPRKTRPLAPLALGAFILVAIAAAGLSTLRTATPVETARVERGPVVLDVVDEGVIRVRDVFVVSAPAGGALTRVDVRPGDRVERGQVLARLDPAPAAPLDPRSAGQADAAIRAARAGVDEALAQLTLARREQARVARLAEQRVAAPAALDQANAQVAAAKAAHETRLAEWRRARATLVPGGQGAGGQAVRAPISGAVLERLQVSEAVVGAGAPILTLGDPTDLEAVGEFLSQDAVRIPAGARARIEDWGGAPLAGRVERVEPFARLRVSALGVEEQRANVVVRLDDPAAAARLGHGYRVNVRVIIAEEAQALRAPVEALVRDAQGWGVFVVDGGRARRVGVELGEASGPYRPVISGLAEGDEVVLFPPQTLRDGTSVKARSAQH